MSNESENTEQSEQTPAAPAPAEVADGTQTGQEAPAAEAPNPSPERAGSTPETIPYHRFQEENHRRRQAEDELARIRAQAQPQQQPQNDPNREPQEGDFPDFMSFQRALMRYEAQRVAYQQQVAMQAQTKVQNVVQSMQQKVIEEGSKDPTAYDLPRVLDAFNGNAANANLVYAIMEAPDTVAVLKHLRANPQEVMRLQYMAPQQQLVEFGMLRAKLAGSKEAPRKPSKDAPNLDLARPGNKPGTGDAYSKDTSVDDYISATRPIPTR